MISTCEAQVEGLSPFICRLCLCEIQTAAKHLVQNLNSCNLVGVGVQAGLASSLIIHRMQSVHKHKTARKQPG
jgi:hypothetical protein